MFLRTEHWNFTRKVKSKYAEYWKCLQTWQKMKVNENIENWQCAICWPFVWSLYYSFKSNTYLEDFTVLKYLAQNQRLKDIFLPFWKQDSPHKTHNNTLMVQVLGFLGENQKIDNWFDPWAFRYWKNRINAKLWELITIFCSRQFLGIYQIEFQ